MSAVSRIACVIAACSLLAAPAAAQIGPGPFAYFPTADTTDARMLSFGCVGINTFEQHLSLTVAVPPGESTFTLSVFDGDTGMADAGGLRHWDLGSRQLLFDLYFDPFATGNTAPADLVGSWKGNDPNPTSGLLWSSDAATMPDNGWWNLTVTVTSEAEAPSGNFFYHLVITEDGICTSTESLASDLKIAASSPMTFLTSRFGFEASMRNISADGPIVYPGFNPAMPVPSPFFWLDNPTTYDGTFEFFLNVPFHQTELTLFDGDFDRGTLTLAGIPSGVALDACGDSDDPNTSALYGGFPVDFFPPGFDIPGAIAAGSLKAEGVNSPGSPPDDNRFDIFRRGELGDDNARGCVRYEVIDPLGTVYANDDPSGNLEWERFRLASLLDPDPAGADVVVSSDTLPVGVWKVRLRGLDLSNLNFWRMETVCAIREGEPACPPAVFIVGDTVFFDSNGNGVQDPGEPGIPGVLVSLIGDPGQPPLATRVTGDTSAPGWDDCVNNNTGLDTAGLYCFGVNDPGDYRVEIDPSNFLPGGPLAGLVSTTGGETQDDTVVDENVLTYDFGYWPTAPGTGTIGYWKNHPEAWPVDSITVGGVTYTKDDAIALMGTPSRGDKTIDLFKQLVAAKLNVLIGNEASCIAATIADADAWLVAHPVGSGVKGSSSAWTTPGSALHETLDDYNNGRLCAPHRD